MGSCPSCGAPVSDTDFACRQCGRSFVADPASLAAASNAYTAPGANSYASPPAISPAMPGAPAAGSLSPDAQSALRYALLGLFCGGFAFGWVAIARAKRARTALRQNPMLGGRMRADIAFYLGWFDVITWGLGLLDFLSDLHSLSR